MKCMSMHLESLKWSFQLTLHSDITIDLRPLILQGIWTSVNPYMRVHGVTASFVLIRSDVIERSDDCYYPGISDQPINRRIADAP